MPNYRYLARCSRTADGQSLGLTPLEVDAAPLLEWIRFGALRRWLDPEAAAAARLVIQPTWHRTSGAPNIEGFTLSARHKGRPAVKESVNGTFLKPQLLEIASRCQKEHHLSAGEKLSCSVLALPESPTGSVRKRGSQDYEEIPVPLTLHPGSLADFQSKSIACGETDPAQIPVFVERHVIDAALDLTRRSPGLESGSILIGRLRSDATAGAIFLEVTALIPARHALSEAAQITFTPDTFAAAEAAINLRKAGEHQVGWQHNHPATTWCSKECIPEAKQACALNTPFFSLADKNFHRVVAWQPYAVALLVTESFTGMKLSMFGWHQGTIVQRGFHIRNPEGAAPLPVAADAKAFTDKDPHEDSCKS